GSMPWPRMLTAVELHDDPRIEAGKIHDEDVDRRLPSEMKTKLPQLAQAQPMSDFLPSHPTAELACNFVGHSSRIAHSPHPARPRSSSIAVAQIRWARRPPHQGEVWSLLLP